MSLLLLLNSLSVSSILLEVEQAPSKEKRHEGHILSNQTDTRNHSEARNDLKPISDSAPYAAQAVSEIMEETL